MKKSTITIIAATCMVLAVPAMAQNADFYALRVVPLLRAMIGKPLLDQAMSFNNSTGFILEELAPEGARFFVGGNSKKAGENADDMRQSHGMIVLITPCPGVHDLTAKISSVSVWETIIDPETARGGVAQADRGDRSGAEDVLTSMNTPPGVVTPSTLRKNHGPVFEYVRGDTIEILSFVNEGLPLRVNWTSVNTSVCPH